MKIGIVSGYFNPVHLGHIEYINAAKNLCDKLIVIVNNDHQIKLKQSKPFMDERHRCFIMNSIKGVETAMISIDTDKSVCKTLRYIKNLYSTDDISFFNSGDRVPTNMNSAECELCNVLDIKNIFINLPKKFSSSELLKNI